MVDLQDRRTEQRLEQTELRDRGQDRLSGEVVVEVGGIGGDLHVEATVGAGDDETRGMIGRMICDLERLRDAAQAYHRALALGALLFAAACAESPEPPRASPWQSHELATDARFRELFFLDERRGWMVGGGWPVEGGIVGRTDDGGESWSFVSGLVERRPNPHSVTLESVQFLDEQRGFLVAGGEILRTVDGGERWHRVHRQGRALRDLQFVDADYGWAVGGATLVRTTDGGESWDAAEPGFFTADAIQFLDRWNGWAVGIAGAIYRTDDGGESWEELRAPTSGVPDLNALAFVDRRTGWAVGERGTILHTNDGGESWREQPGATRIELTDVRFIDASRGWAVGFERGDSSSSILRTVDGGESWSHPARIEGQALYALWIDEDGRGFAVGERVRPSPQLLVVRKASDAAMRSKAISSLSNAPDSIRSTSR